MNLSGSSSQQVDTSLLQQTDETLENDKSKSDSSSNNMTNSSNNTLDELLDELDKTNSKLIQVNLHITISN